MGDLLTDPMVLLVVAAEVAFWVLLAAGLAARYLWRARRCSTVLLGAIPAVAAALLGLAAVDVARGTPPGAAHGLTGLYLGFTLAFGPATIRWADRRAARRAGREVPAPADGPVARAWREWARVLGTGLVTVAACAVLALAAGTGIPAPTAWPADPMWSWASRVGSVVAVWFVAGPLWATGRARARS